MTTATLLCFALILDAIFGEPRAIWSRLPHPAVLMGRAVGWVDEVANSGRHRRAKGTASFAALAIATLLLGFCLSALPPSNSVWCNTSAAIFTATLPTVHPVAHQRCTSVPI